MERLQELISKLNEQSEQNESALQMLMTLKQIEAELTQVHAVAVTGRKNPGVSIVMPSMPFSMRASEELVATDTVNEEKINSKNPSRPAQPIPSGHQAWMGGDPMIEIPTLSHQPGNREINDLIGSGTSINDRLKTGNPQELASTLKSPVKELRKAIGVNDRFVFINELFRGDEAMYERSIKTINNFRILPEAEYWMERELKIKIGWDDSREIVQHFYQLVRRRFS